MTGTQKEDAKLRIYLDDAFEKEYPLKFDTTSKHIEIDLRHAKNLKIELIGKTDTIYGFANVVLEF